MYIDFILQGKTFQLLPSSAVFAQKYLDRVRSYVTLHSLSSDYYNDIETRFVEKIEEKIVANTPMSESDMVRIVNELGEPEDIFRDTKNSPPLTNTSSISMRGPFHRNSTTGMIFGVCSGLGESFGLDPVYFRLIFVLSTLFFGTGILFYIVLALLLKNNPRSVLEIQKEDPKVYEKSSIPLVKTLHRNSTTGMIFGVCSGLGESFGLDPVYFRLFFILLVLFFGTGVLAYILLAFLLKDIPSPSLEKSEMSLPTLSEGPIKQTIEGIPTAIKGTINGTSNVGKSIFSFISRIVFAFVCIFFGLMLGGIALAFIFGSSVFLSRANFGNSFALPVMPEWFYASLVVASLVFSLFSLAALAYAFGKKFLSDNFFSVLIVALIVSVIGCISGVISLVSHYSFSEAHETTYPLIIQSGSLDMDMKISKDISYGMMHLGQKNSFVDLEFKTTDSLTGSIVLRETFHTKDQASQKILHDSLFPIRIVEVGGKITVSLSGSSVAPVGIPFAFPERTIIVTVPKALSVRVSGYEGSIRGLSWGEIVPYIQRYPECAGADIRYNENTKNLECNPMGYDLKTLQSGYARYIDGNIERIIGQKSLNFLSIVEWKDSHTALVRYEKNDAEESVENTVLIHIDNNTDGDIRAKVVSVQ